MDTKVNHQPLELYYTILYLLLDNIDISDTTLHNIIKPLSIQYCTSFYLINSPRPSLRCTSCYPLVTFQHPTSSSYWVQQRNQGLELTYKNNHCKRPPITSWSHLVKTRVNLPTDNSKDKQKLKQLVVISTPPHPYTILSQWDWEQSGHMGILKMLQIVKAWTRSFFIYINTFACTCGTPACIQIESWQYLQDIL